MTTEPETAQFSTPAGLRIDPTDWEARAASMFASPVPEDETSPEDVAAALREFYLRDERQVTWIYDGTTWTAWDGATWASGRPTGSLRLLPFTFGLIPQPEERPPLGVPPLEETTDAVLPVDPSTPQEIDERTAEPWDTSTAASPIYRCTHTVPAPGLPAWSTPDPSATPAAQLNPGLDVMVAEQHANGWTRIICSNGWGGWVDGRRLIPG